jgi:hypothetical protein
MESLSVYKVENILLTLENILPEIVDRRVT